LLDSTKAPADGVEPVVLVRREDVAFRLFAFPHAGGNHNSFGGWSAGLPDDVELISYSLPGRNGQDTLPYQRWQSMIDDLAALVHRHDDGTPFAFFGHSLGALVAFEVCRQLAAENRRTPAVLFLSAYPAPHLSSDQERHSLPADRFLDLVRDWGLVPAEFLENEELLQLVLPPLRNDLKLAAEYVCQTGGQTGKRLSVPCVVYGGAADKTVSLEELRAWREHFEEGTSVSVATFPGGHFYTTTAQADLLKSISGQLDRVRGEIGWSVAIEGTAYSVPDRGVWARFQQHVTSSPDALALIDRSRRWSYRELNDDATALASDLAALGAGRGDVVGILLPHSAEYCISLLTCFGMGTPACLLEKNWPAGLLSQFLESADVKIVVTVPELAGLLPPSFQDPGKLVVLGQEQTTKPPSIEKAEIFPDVAPTDIALISMTSGTSGTPKAVLNTHLGCLYCFDARYELYPYRESSRDGLNVFFGWECLRPLLQGKSAAVIPDDCIFDPIRLIDTLEEFGITRIVIPSSLFESVLDHPVAGQALPDRLGHMEIVFLMGEVVPARVVEKAAALLPAHVRLVNAYSTWESLDVSFADLRAGASEKTTGSSSFAPVGRILAGSAAILLNDKGEPVPYGGVGELYFSGPGVAVGYLNDPAKTAERFVPCPAAFADSPIAGAVFYRTGDRARFLSGGDLEILGRIGDIVKLRGFKVSLRAVESVLEDQAGISRVIVRPVLDSRTKQPASLLAYLVGDQGKPSDTVLARSRHKAKRDLPEYARPRQFIGLDALPISRSDSRKLDLAALPVPPEEPYPAGGTASALTTMEQRIAQAWSEVLGIPSVEPEDNFFDVGGDSLSAARLSGLLAERFGISLPVIEVFQVSTLRDMAEHCARGGGSEPSAAPVRRARPAETTRLAVVGMAGRFPGASTIDTFWENLKNGTDSLTTFPAERLRQKGVAAEVLADPKWVSAGQLLSDADKFDAEFWGIGQREAVMMDPQHRVFIEVAWLALEQAGYARRDNPYRRRTGVFAACGIDGYLIHHLEGGGLKDPLDPAGVFLTEIGNEKDYIATRVAYLLDLGGPAVTVTSACSSALVAVAQAAQSIVSGQCDMAIAGASSINFPNFGYRYEDGLVGSLDGHVRPFDVEASGTLFGDSVGAVVLKRVEDAIEDGDHIWAVLTGFGVSNDGRMKAGYTAPSARAQAQCISDAIAMAGIDSAQLSYVECHATATHVGDAIEIKGLLDAFTAHRGDIAPRTGGCSIGSVKGNIGHANCAAGITGFIKTVLCLYHRTLVPTVNYQTLNPKLVGFVDHEGSPFTVQEACADWTVADPQTQLPRRAGVSSFGIGGTNAHVILEEAPEIVREEPDQANSRSLHLVTLSARSETAFRRNADTLVRFIEGLPDAEIAPAIRYLHISREPHPLRASAVLEQGAAAGLDDLRRLAAQPPRAALRQGHAATVAFCFSGQGSQTAGMARGLYRARADGGRFRRHFDAVCEILARHVPCDPAGLILGADDTSVMRPMTTQCGLFAVEYALARTLMDIGVTPVAVAGHSIGEYAAAAVSGLLTLEEASALVAVRAQASEDLLLDADGAAGDGIGGMLSVVGDEDRLTEWLADREGLWLAVENGPGRVVLSGTKTALRDAQSELPALGFACRPVPVSHPFHTGLMAPVAERLNATAGGLDARVPVVPMASNLTGSWIDSLYQPGTYWGEHMTSKVRWRDDLEMLLKWEPDIILEVGPGTVLTTLTRKFLEHRAVSDPLPIATMPDARNPDADDEASLLRAVGELWCQGVDLDFAAFHEGERTTAGGSAVRRLLPTYSFDRSSYWTRPNASVYVDREPAAPSAAGAIESADNAPRQLVRFAEKPGARVKLYCFPYAGGHSGAFRAWAHAAPQWLDVVAVELPGRNGQADRATPANDHDDTTLLEHLATRVRSDAGSTAVAFCGLSFGASVLLDLLGGPLADWAGTRRITAVSVVGRTPIAPGAGTAEPPLDSYLMVPDEMRDDEQWAQSVLPLLEADLAFDARAERRIVERQQHHGTQVIDTPLQVHCGTEDPSFPSASAEDWAAVTGSPIVDVHRHPGSHDFMLHHRDHILDRLVAFLERLGLPDAPDHGPWTGRLHEVRWVPVRSSAHVEAPREIPWIDFDDSELAASARFLRDNLTGPGSKAALLCRLPANLTPRRHYERFLELLKSAVAAEVRGQLILVLPARDASGLPAGMTRSLVHEEPGLTVQRVYVHGWSASRHEDVSEWIGWLLSQAQAHPEEVDLLHRGGHLLARRLLPATLPDLPPGTLGVPGGNYLITGGTGGIGSVIADWLIHNQRVEPGRVVVSGRTAPRDLRRGVRFLEMDLARPIDVGALAAETGSLAGIIHLAGALDDGVLRNLDASRSPAVLAPKLALPQLSELGSRAGAPWILAFSSTSALLGAPGQANYAAANAWMDAHAMWPAPDEGPSVVSINWGTWGDVGMAARSTKALDAARADGEKPLRSGVALSLLGKIVASVLAGDTAARNLAVCDVDWDRSPWAGMPLVAELPEPSSPDRPFGQLQNPGPLPDADPGIAVAENPDGPDGPDSPDDDIRSFLDAYVHRWDESKQLMDLGLDSLDFARMRGDFARLFGKDVPLAEIAKPDQRLGELYALFLAY
jgi:acyl transferase domain-containing protein/surfactin synthase thioesterase subunit/non-ribosomal peptide synthetase component F/acyl carrier protein